MITSPPPPGAGQVFGNAFAGADLASTALKAIQAFATCYTINQQAQDYLNGVFQNYLVHVAQIQSNLHAGFINRAQAINTIDMWKQARDGAILAVQGINAAVAQAATNAAIAAVVGIIGSALDAALKAFL
jgi:hypothetical protein